jgi:aerobic-type carbon monoxide dehydrogenase small subunit (CoxS/CutS family)
MEEAIQLTLNGKPVRVAADGGRKLLWVLRSDLGLTGSKCGCGQGSCGACTVLLAGEPVRSCSIPLKEVSWLPEIQTVLVDAQDSPP